MCPGHDMREGPSGTIALSLHAASRMMGFSYTKKVIPVPASQKKKSPFFVLFFVRFHLRCNVGHEPFVRWGGWNHFLDKVVIEVDYHCVPAAVHFFSELIDAATYYFRRLQKRKEVAL